MKNLQTNHTHTIIVPKRYFEIVYEIIKNDNSIYNYEYFISLNDTKNNVKYCFWIWHDGTLNKNLLNKYAI